MLVIAKMPFCYPVFVDLDVDKANGSLLFWIAIAVVVKFRSQYLVNLDRERIELEESVYMLKDL